MEMSSQSCSMVKCILSLINAPVHSLFSLSNKLKKERKTEFLDLKQFVFALRGTGADIEQLTSDRKSQVQYLPCLLMCQSVLGQEPRTASCGYRLVPCGSRATIHGWLEFVTAE